VTLVRPSRFIAALVVVMSVLSAPAVQACATCFGQSDELMAKGMNMGILALLICIVGVLVGIASVGFYFIRRAARIEAAQSSDTPGVFGAPVVQTTK
jgi:DUF1365 family protein